MYFYCFFSFEYFDPYDHYAACWVTLITGRWDTKRDNCRSETLKRIFHCNAKLLALGTFASPNAKDSTFASRDAKNTNMLVSLTLGDANFLRWPYTFHYFCVDFIRVG